MDIILILSSPAIVAGIAAVGLFIAAVVVDRAFYNDDLLEKLLLWSGVLWWMCFAMLWFLVDFFLVRGQAVYDFLDRSPSLSYEWFLVVSGGWVRILMAFFFTSAAGAGVNWVLATWFIDSEIRHRLLGPVVLSLLAGTAVVVGFLAFLEGVQLVLGIIATVIAGTLGIVKLHSMWRGNRSGSE